MHAPFAAVVDIEKMSWTAVSVVAMSTAVQLPLQMNSNSTFRCQSTKYKFSGYLVLFYIDFRCSIHRTTITLLTGTTISTLDSAAGAL